MLLPKFATGWRRKPWVLATLGAFLVGSPVGTQADDETLAAKKNLWAAEILSVLEFRNESTGVTLEQCVFAIDTLLRPDCFHDSAPKQKRTNIVLSEVVALTTNPFRSGYALKFELDVARPSTVSTLINRVTKSESEAFDIFVAEVDTLLAASRILSGTTIISCSGQAWPRKMRTITFFVDEISPSWSEFESYVAGCHTPR